MTDTKLFLDTDTPKIRSKVEVIVEATKKENKGCLTCDHCTTDDKVNGGFDLKAEYTQIPCAHHGKYVPVRVNCPYWKADV